VKGVSTNDFFAINSQLTGIPVLLSDNVLAGLNPAENSVWRRIFCGKTASLY
jgi:hypothetical protein